jgi:Icc-related predicted phosphoesterase
MYNCIFVSDLHGSLSRYKKLFQIIEEELPDALFMGGDLLPSGLIKFASKNSILENFFESVFLQQFQILKQKLRDKYPRVFIILGNDDCKADEEAFLKGELLGLWEYAHNKRIEFHDYEIYGYSNIPPTPFLLKDWERYDVSRYVDPGCIHPNEGYRTTEVDIDDIICTTIKDELKRLTAFANFSKSILLFHVPPYRTKLDRADLDGKTYEHVPLDVHVGSIAVQRLIDEKQPLLSLHGHVHESTLLTGIWKDHLGNTIAYNGAHHGEELAVIRFDPSNPDLADRQLV